MNYDIFISDDAMGALPAPQTGDQWRLLIYAPAFADDRGQIRQSAPAFDNLDKITLASLAENVKIVLVPFAAATAQRHRQMDCDKHTFAAVFARGMDVWDPESVAMQERFICGFFARKNARSNQFWHEMGNIEAVELYDSIENLLARMSPEPESLQKARQDYYAMRQDVADAEKPALFRDHIFRNLIMFLQPALLHCFGNQVQLSLGRIDGNNAQSWREVLRPILEHNAMSLEHGTTQPFHD
ncbi:MAG: hypothetical protein PHS41_08705 [Victivallaceae bacterium]|nr:hypothetical protein [Victivallaceae bacterium]